jgi:hypothetical protein
VREDRLLEGILGFFDERLFVPHRRDLLERDLASFDGEPERIRHRQMRSLRRAIEKLDLAQNRRSVRAPISQDLVVGYTSE